MLSVWLALLATTCSETGDDHADAASGMATRIRDTTGAAFDFTAETAAGLQSTEGIAIECAGSTVDAFAFVPGKTGLALVCGVDPSGGRPADYLCRPVACDPGFRCPAGFGCAENVCRCSAADCRERDGGDRVDSLELMAQCLARTPRFPKCLDAFTDPSWGAASRALLDACDGEGLCTIPAGCR